MVPLSVFFSCVLQAQADYTLKMFDLDTERVVRVFKGHMARITDVAWSPDARWIVSASMDSTVRTWGELPRSPVPLFSSLSQE